LGGVGGLGNGFVDGVVVLVLLVVILPVLFNLIGTEMRGMIVAFLAILAFTVRLVGPEMTVRLAGLTIVELVAQEIDELKLLNFSDTSKESLVSPTDSVLLSWILAIKFLPSLDFAGFSS
jgi:hypothetical protein